MSKQGARRVMSSQRLNMTTKPNDIRGVNRCASKRQASLVVIVRSWLRLLKKSEPSDFVQLSFPYAAHEAILIQFDPDF